MQDVIDKVNFQDINSFKNYLKGFSTENWTKNQCCLHRVNAIREAQ